MRSKIFQGRNILMKYSFQYSEGGPPTPGLLLYTCATTCDMHPPSGQGYVCISLGSVDRWCYRGQSKKVSASSADQASGLGWLEPRMSSVSCMPSVTLYHCVLQALTVCPGIALHISSQPLPSSRRRARAASCSGVQGSPRSGVRKCSAQWLLAPDFVRPGTGSTQACIEARDKEPLLPFFPLRSILFAWALNLMQLFMPTVSTTIRRAKWKLCGNFRPAFSRTHGGLSEATLPPASNNNEVLQL